MTVDNNIQSFTKGLVNSLSQKRQIPSNNLPNPRLGPDPISATVRKSRGINPDNIITPFINVTDMEISYGTTVAESLGETDRNAAKIFGKALAEIAKSKRLLPPDLVRTRETANLIYRFRVLEELNRNLYPPGVNRGQIIQNANRLRNTPNGNLISSIKRNP